jgi:hypothetical protein
MNYRVGRKQKRVVLDENGLEVGKFNKGNEYLAELTCKFLNLEQTLPIDSVSSSTEHKKYMVWDDLFGILAWKFKQTKSGDMYLEGEKVYDELKDKFELKRK